MGTRQEQKAATRHRVLTAATRLIGERGFAATRTADVARATRLSHGPLFVHFPSREALDLAVASELGRRVTDRLHALAERKCTFRDALVAHVRVIEEHEDLYRRLLIEGSMLPGGVARTWTAIQSAVSHHLLSAAEPEMRAGRLREQPLHLLFNTWIALVHHYLINRALFVRSGSVLHKHGRTLVDHYLALVTP